MSNIQTAKQTVQKLSIDDLDALIRYINKVKTSLYRFTKYLEDESNNQCGPVYIENIQ